MNVCLKILTLKSFPLRSTPRIKGRTPVAAISNYLMSAALFWSLWLKRLQYYFLVPEINGM